MSNCKRAVDDKRLPDDNHPDVPEEWPDVPEEWPDVADEDVWEWQESDPKAPNQTVASSGRNGVSVSRRGMEKAFKGVIVWHLQCHQRLVSDSSDRHS